MVAHIIVDIDNTATKAFDRVDIIPPIAHAR